LNISFGMKRLCADLAAYGKSKASIYRRLNPSIHDFPAIGICQYSALWAEWSIILLNLNGFLGYEFTIWSVKLLKTIRPGEPFLQSTAL